MSVNKNFVVKNGLEVNTNLILADANTNKVGIGSTAPRFELDVAGGIGATNFYLSGIGTVLNELNVGTDGSVLTVLGVGGSVGVGTALPRYLLDIRSPVSTGQTALYVQGDVKITGDLSVDDITFDDASVSNLTISEALNVTSPGISTFGGYVDINSSADISGTLNVTGVTTTNGLNVIGYGEFDDINVSGVATISQLDVQSDFDVYAPSTFYNNVTIDGNLTVNGTETIINTQSLFVNDKDIVLGIGTTPGNETDASANHGGIAVASTEGSPLISLVAAGINTFPDTYKQIMWVAGETFGVGTTDAWLFNYAVGVGSTQVPNGVRFAASAIQFTDDTINTPNINVSDTSILDGVKIATGIVTASSGIVTYYGDGSKLSNVISGVGIRTSGGLVGTGATTLDFRGSGISTVTVSAGIATINITGGSGGGGSVSISSVAPTSPSNGNLWYSIDYGRTFIYYDEVALGIGSTAVWVDSAPFNQGGLYVNKYGDNMLSGLGVTVGSLTSPSVYFNGYTNSGFYSPEANQFGVVVSGNQRLNVNSSGINVSGVTTSGGVNVTTGNDYKINSTSVLTSTTLGSSVVNSSLTSVGTLGQLNVSGVTTSTDFRLLSIAEKTTVINGNTVNLTYNTGGGNIAICTNPTGNITLNVIGIPTNSNFNNNSLSFSVIVQNTGTARSCTAVNLNGVSETILWFGGSLSSAISGVTTTTGYDIYSFVGINTIGSAATTSNYTVLGNVNGGYR